MTSTCTIRGHNCPAASRHCSHYPSPSIQLPDHTRTLHATSNPRPLSLLRQPTYFAEPSQSVHLHSNYSSPAYEPTPSGPSAWHMYQAQQRNMGGPDVTSLNLNAGLKRSREHQRTPSSSTIDSNGSASPYMSNTAYTAKHLPTPSQTPTDAAFASTLQQMSDMPSAHLAMKDFAMDHHNHIADEDCENVAPSRQSMSSYGQDSPATPQSGSDDVEVKDLGFPTSTSSFRNAIQLHRTESQVYQDELYNPNFVYTSAPASKPRSTYLSPHRNLITERLQTANLARSASPSSAISRERSPFVQQASPNALLQDWKPSPGQVGTAAHMRQQQKEEAEQAELARQKPVLKREPTKTISPKDAMLDDFNDSDAPLFQDSVPVGYKQHLGGTEQRANNMFSGQSNNIFQGLPSSSQHSLVNANSADQAFVPNFDFPLMTQNGNNNNLQTTAPTSTYQPVKMGYADHTPEFPIGLPSMESSVSDVGPGTSSQESVMVRNSTPLRPDDTRANSGTYTCTYHGCTERFDSPANLQRHKRDFHRSQAQRESASVSGAESVSPSRSSGSPAPSGSGMTSAAILARNSQAGPHKCTRINPSTGKPCNTIFSRPYDLTRHEDTIHNNRKQKVRCPLCREEKTFSRNDALTRHMRVVHPEVEAYGKRGRRGD